MDKQSNCVTVHGIQTQGQAIEESQGVEDLPHRVMVPETEWPEDVTLTSAGG